MADKTTKTFTPISDEISKNGVVSLATRPNQPSSYGRGDLSATELKKRFDYLANEIIVAYNKLIGVFNSEEILGYFKAHSGSLKSALEQITNTDGELITKNPEDRKGENEVLNTRILAFYNAIVELQAFTEVNADKHKDKTLSDVYETIANVELFKEEVKKDKEENAKAHNAINDLITALQEFLGLNEHEGDSPLDDVVKCHISVHNDPESLAHSDIRQSVEEAQTNANEYAETVVSEHNVSVESHSDIRQNVINAETNAKGYADGILREHNNNAEAHTSIRESVTAVSGDLSSHKTANDSHNDIRLLVKELSDRINALHDTDDTTLDQTKEIVAYIKANRALIESITTSKVNVDDIIANLTTNVDNKPLAASQGVALKDLIDTLTTEALNYAKKSDLDGYVKKDGNKVLSDNNFSDADKAKVDTSLQPTDILDGLGYTSTVKPLSANQGRVLKGMIDDLAKNVGNTDKLNGLDVEYIENLVDPEAGIKGYKISEIEYRKEPMTAEGYVTIPPSDTTDYYYARLYLNRVLEGTYAKGDLLQVELANHFYNRYTIYQVSTANRNGKTVSTLLVHRADSTAEVQTHIEKGFELEADDPKGIENWCYVVGKSHGDPVKQSLGAVAGGENTIVTGRSAGGFGRGHRVLGAYGFAGGRQNTIGYGASAFGRENTSYGDVSFIAGGYKNLCDHGTKYSFIGGGQENKIKSEHSSILGTRCEIPSGLSNVRLFGYGLKANKADQVVYGKFNQPDDFFEAMWGIGNTENTRDNGMAMSWDGSLYVKKDIYVGGVTESNKNKLVTASEVGKLSISDIPLATEDQTGLMYYGDFRFLEMLRNELKNFLPSNELSESVTKRVLSSTTQESDIPIYYKVSVVIPVPTYRDVLEFSATMDGLRGDVNGVKCEWVASTHKFTVWGKATAPFDTVTVTLNYTYKNEYLS